MRSVPVTNKNKKFFSILYKQRFILLMSIPFLIWMAIFMYRPMYGLLYAFQNFNPTKGVLGSDWVGLKHFIRFFNMDETIQAVRNTLVIASSNLVLHNLVPVFFALLINEIFYNRFKRVIQTISYLPHFVSFAVVSSIFVTMMSMNGPINASLVNLGITEKPILFWANAPLFWILVPLINIWKEVGWAAIIYLAAIAGINLEIYEASAVDGCNRIRKIWHVTLPGIIPTIVTLWVLSISGIISAGFDPSYLLGNAANRSHSDVIDTLAYRYGLGMGQYSFSTAIGLMQMAIGFVVVAISNKLAKKLTDYSLW